MKMWKMNPVCWTTRKNTCPEQEWSPDLLKAEIPYNRQNANNKNALETKQLIVTDAGCDNRERGGKKEEGICKWLDSAQKHLCTLINPWKKQERDLLGGLLLLFSCTDARVREETGLWHLLSL